MRAGRPRPGGRTSSTSISSRCWRRSRISSKSRERIPGCRAAAQPVLLDFPLPTQHAFADLDPRDRLGLLVEARGMNNELVVLRRHLAGDEAEGTGRRFAADENEPRQEAVEDIVYGAS